MKVWILQTGEPMPFDNDGLRPMRAINLSDALNAAGHEVVLWTADFDHRTHSHRYGRDTEVRGRDGLTVRFLHTHGYRRNISPGRLADHAELGLALRRRLRREQAPDAAFVGYPPIEPAMVMIDWLRSRATPSILDVKDAWPDVLNRAFPFRLQPLSKKALAPYYAMMRRTFRGASALSSTAEPFLQWSLAQAGRQRNDFDMVLPLVSELRSISDEDQRQAGAWWDAQGVSLDRVLRVSFVGTLHRSYAWEPVYEAARDLPEVQFVVCGGGSEFERLRVLFQDLGNVVMPGWVSAVQARALSARSDVAIAPVGPHPDFEMSIPNKFHDAMALGTPILTSLPGAARDFVEAQQVGRFYDASTPHSLTALIVSLIERPQELQALRLRGQQLHGAHLSVREVYGAAVKRLEELAKQEASR